MWRIFPNMGSLLKDCYEVVSNAVAATLARPVDFFRRGYEIFVDGDALM